MKTIINTARSKNKDDHIGIRVYPTRNVRGQKGKFLWFRFIAPDIYQSDEIKAGNDKPYIINLEFYSKAVSVDYCPASYYKFKEFLAALKKHPEITLLCFCEDVDKCHRKILAKWLVENFSDKFELGDIK